MGLITEIQYRKHVHPGTSLASKDRETAHNLTINIPEIIIMDSHRTTTYRRNPGFLERIGSSLVGILVGLALLLIASALLFWNEGRAVQTAKSLDEGMNMVVSLKTVDVASRENNGKLVHLIGPLSTDNVLYDEAYGVSVHAVKLKRTVEMYQWVEHEKKTEYNEGGKTRVETTYSYTKEWRSDLVRSNSFSDGFNHRNPTTMQVESKNLEAYRVNVGQFELSKGLINRITEFHPIPLSYLHPHQDPQVKLFNGAFYHSSEPLYPLVGDLRVHFEYAGISGESPLGSPTQVSIIARQLGSELLPYKTLAGDDLELLYYGQLSPEEIFNKEKIQNTMVTWGIRFGGWLLMFIGFSLITSLITTIVDWIPIVRELVMMGVNLMNLAFSISLSLTVIAMGWIVYRPFLGLSILALALVPLFLSKFQSRESYRARHD